MNTSKQVNTIYDVIRSGDYLVLDTETTGLDDGEIVQIAIINSEGVPLLDTLVKPIFRIPEDATRIHGITDDDVADAPGWDVVSALVYEIVFNRDVLIYNAVYDRKMMHRSSEKAGIARVDWKSFARFWCVMEAYAEFYGEWNDYYGQYRWQRLTAACRQQGIQVSHAHNALGDCLMTLEVARVLGKKQ